MSSLLSKKFVWKHNLNLRSVVSLNNKSQSWAVPSQILFTGQSSRAGALWWLKNYSHPWGEAVGPWLGARTLAHILGLHVGFFWRLMFLAPSNTWWHKLTEPRCRIRVTFLCGHPRLAPRVNLPNLQWELGANGLLFLGFSSQCFISLCILHSLLYWHLGSFILRKLKAQELSLARYHA